MKRTTLLLGGSQHGRRIELDNQPPQYVYQPKAPKQKRSMVNGCNAYELPAETVREVYHRVWVQHLEVEVYVLEGYEPTVENEELVGSQAADR